MRLFEHVYEEWLQDQIEQEKGQRRRELLRKGLGHGTVEFLRTIWFPAIGNLNHVYPEYEVRDLHNRIRYLDIAYKPGGAKGCIEIHGFRSHARDIEISRFKDLCMKQALLVLDDWYFLPIAYASITEDPEVCKQLVLAFVGKFLSTDQSSKLSWAEAETLRFSQRLMRPFTPQELKSHLRLSEQQTRKVLRKLVGAQKLVVASGKVRYRTYRLPEMLLPALQANETEPR